MASFRSVSRVGTGRKQWKARGFEIAMWPWVRPADGSQWYRLGAGRYPTRQVAQEQAEVIKGKYAELKGWAPVRQIPQ